MGTLDSRERHQHAEQTESAVPAAAPSPSRCPRWAEAPRPQPGAAGNTRLRFLLCKPREAGWPTPPWAASPHAAGVFAALGGHSHTLRPAKAVSRVPGGLTSEGPDLSPVGPTSPSAEDVRRVMVRALPSTPRKGPRGQSKGRGDRTAHTSAKRPVQWPWPAAGHLRGQGPRTRHAILRLQPSREQRRPLGRDRESVSAAPGPGTRPWHGLRLRDTRLGERASAHQSSDVPSISGFCV